MEHVFTHVVCTTCGSHFDVPVYCGDRFCPICSSLRLNRVRRRLNFLIDNVKREDGYCFKHLTLTIRNQPNLSHMTHTIMKSFRKLRQTDSWKSHVLGGAFVIEVTGTTGNWHVHLHIVMQSKFYEFSEILKEWMRVSPGRGVWIDNISKNRAVGYLTKYITKCSVLETEKDELNRALKGTRLFQPFGTWFAINRLYEPPKAQCKTCDDPCFCLYGEVFKGEDFFRTKDVPLSKAG